MLYVRHSWCNGRKPRTVDVFSCLLAGMFYAACWILLSLFLPWVLSGAFTVGIATSLFVNGFLSAAWGLSVWIKKVVD